MLFWEHLGGLDSKYNKIEIEEDDISKLTIIPTVFVEV